MRYRNAKIYKLTSLHTELVYVGITIKTLKQQFEKHSVDYDLKTWGCTVKHCPSFAIFEAGDCIIELIEDYPCETKKQLESRQETIRNGINDRSFVSGEYRSPN